MLTSLTLAYISPSLFNDLSPLRPKMLISRFGVPTIFLVSSLSLPSSELSRSIKSPLNLPIQLLSLLLIPLLNFLLLPLYKSILPLPYVTGLLLLSALPTTVNMCIALTSNSNGNIAISVTNAVLGNLLGIVATPLWFTYMTKSGSLAVPPPVSFLKTLTSLSKKVLLPMLVGQGLRYTRARKVHDRNKGKAKRTSEIILLSIVLNSFSNAFSSSSSLTLPITLTLLPVTLLLHLSYFGITFKFMEILKVPPKDVVASSFVVSHKTLAFGLPLIKTVFAGDPNLSALIAPIMIVHPMQLFVGGLMKDRLKRYIKNDGRKEGGRVGGVPRGGDGMQENTRLYLVGDKGFARKFIMSLVGIVVALRVPEVSSLFSEVTLNLAHWAGVSMLASSCCAFQVVLNYLSFGCAGFNKFLGPIRPLLLASACALQAVAWGEAFKHGTGWRRMIVGTSLTGILSFSPEVLHGVKKFRSHARRGSNPAPSFTLDLTSSIGCSPCEVKVQSVALSHPRVTGCEVSNGIARIYTQQEDEGVRNDLTQRLETAGFKVDNDQKK